MVMFVLIHWGEKVSWRGKSTEKNVGGTLHGFYLVESFWTPGLREVRKGEKRLKGFIRLSGKRKSHSRAYLPLYEEDEEEMKRVVKGGEQASR